MDEQPAQPLLSAAEPDVRFWPTDWSDDGRYLIGVGKAGRDAPSPRLSSYSFKSRQFEHLLTEFDGRAMVGSMTGAGYFFAPAESSS